MWRRTMHPHKVGKSRSGDELTAPAAGNGTCRQPYNVEQQRQQRDSQLREMLWAEFLIRKSRPLPPSMPSTNSTASVPSSSRLQEERLQLQDEIRQRQRRPKSARPLVGLSAEEPTTAELARLLNEKEQDLELAAKLGNSLLQENKELQEKNEFLEESLATSNDTISQLQKQLKLRSKLFHTIVDLEREQDEQEGKGSAVESKPENSARLERQICHLEGENKELRMKAKHLEERNTSVERREERRISEFMSQLRGANLKIAQLQVQLGEKVQQCEAQSEEVQRLLKEITQRKTREKILWEENEDIQSRLDEALLNHEQLRNELEQLQERHLDLVSMLRETEDELRMHREKAQNAALAQPRRTNSTDSLYDSLASELEGADSGYCYNTPMFSARYGPSPHWSSLSGNDQQQGCSTSSTAAPPDQIQPQPEMEPIEEQGNVKNCRKQLKDAGSQSQSFDVPSRALLDAVRSTFEDRRKFMRRQSPSNDGGNGQQQSVTEENQMDEEQPTPTASTMLTMANIIVVQKTYCDAACSPIQFSRRESCASTMTTPRRRGSTPIGQKNEEAITAIDEHEQPPEDPKSTPILRQMQTSTLCPNQLEIQQEEKPQIEQDQPGPMAASCSSSSTESGDDSMEDYAPPKLGAPGRPGTKDLDFSIRRLNLRREKIRHYGTSLYSKLMEAKAQKYSHLHCSCCNCCGDCECACAITISGNFNMINENYQRFRASKGLPPAHSSFYSDGPYQIVYQSAFGSKCPSKQLKQLSQCCHSTSAQPCRQQQSPLCSRFSFRQNPAGIQHLLPANGTSPPSSPAALTAGICRLVDFLGKKSSLKTAAIGGIVKSESCSSGLDQQTSSSTGQFSGGKILPRKAALLNRLASGSISNTGTGGCLSLSSESYLALLQQQTPQQQMKPPKSQQPISPWLALNVTSCSALNPSTSSLLLSANTTTACCAQKTAAPIELGLGNLLLSTTTPTGTNTAEMMGDLPAEVSPLPSTTGVLQRSGQLTTGGKHVGK